MYKFHCFSNIFEGFWDLWYTFQDPWWNPAVEEQAIMRIHRIGQMKKVQIKRFIIKVHLRSNKKIMIHGMSATGQHCKFLQNI